MSALVCSLLIHTLSGGVLLWFILSIMAGLTCIRIPTPENKPVIQLWPEHISAVASHWEFEGKFNRDVESSNL